jgi:hypothetical protein
MGEGRPRRAGGAALLLILSFILAACGSAATAAPSGVSAASAASSAGPSAAAASSTPAATTAADRLAAAFAGLAGGYTFDTTITVGGKVATHVSGRSVGGASEFVLESGGQSVTYRSVPPQAWVQKSGSGWTLVTSGGPAGDPLGQLAKPQGTSVTSDDPAALVVDATYAPSALGLSGTDPVHVTLTVAADGSITATYTNPSNGGTATSTTVLKPTPGQQPIAAPSTAPSASPG